MNAYAEPAPIAEELQLLTSADIDVLFKRKRGWFDHSRTRDALYARGFPRPVSAGRWSPLQVREWLANPQPKPKRRRRASSNGYAQP